MARAAVEVMGREAAKAAVVKAVRVERVAVAARVAAVARAMGGAAVAAGAAGKARAAVAPVAQADADPSIDALLALGRRSVLQPIVLQCLYAETRPYEDDELLPR